MQKLSYYNYFLKLCVQHSKYKLYLAPKLLSQSKLYLSFKKVSIKMFLILQNLLCSKHYQIFKSVVR